MRFRNWIHHSSEGITYLFDFDEESRGVWTGSRRPAAMLAMAVFCARVTSVRMVDEEKEDEEGGPEVL